MREKLIALLAASLLALSQAAWGADDGAGCKLTGSIGIGVQGVNVNALDPSKFREYRDMSNGLLPNFEFKGRCADDYVNAYGENLGRDDQYMNLNGGQYGIFKYQLYDNNLRHNFGSGPGARTPYFGAGGASLTAPFTAAGITNRNPENWNTFDNSYSRKDIGGMFEFSNNSPFYARFDGNQIKREGIKVLAGGQGTSPGNGFIDLPSPVDFTDNNIAGEIGYQSKKGHVALNFMQNKFTNANSLLNWTNGFFQGTDTTVLPPESTLTKVSLNGNLRQLPGSSVLAGRMTYSKTANEVAVLPGTLGAAGAVLATASNSPGFIGDVVNKTASLTLNSQPAPKFDTRVYWNFNQKDNRSTQLTFTPVAALQCGGLPCVTEVYNYKKNNFGFEGGYRFNPENKLGFGIDYLDADYERIDYIRDIDRKYSIEWKNSSFESLDTRAKYQRLVRTATFVDRGNFNAFQRRFDLASVNQDMVKATFDSSPRPLLNLGFELIYKHNDFTSNTLTLGRTKDERGELYASVGYGDPSSFRVLLFGNAEYVKFQSLHRVGAVPASGDPSAPPNPAPPAVSTSFTYAGKDRDKSYLIGLGADWVPRERWKVNSSATWARTQGTVDFTAAGGANPAAPGLVPIPNYDNTITITLNIKGTYSYSRSWDFTGGYAYQHFDFSSIAMNGYNYINGAGSAAAMASGLYAFPQSNSNTVYGMVKYKFE